MHVLICWTIIHRPHREADMQEKKQQRGKNVLAEEAKKSFAASFFEQLNDPLIFILIVAAAISMLLSEFGDAVIILAVILMNAFVGVIQEGKAQRALDALKEMTSPHALIKEGNVIREIEASQLVPGDIVCLEAGRQVPADLRLIEAVNLQIEEAALTGESVPVKKDTRQNNRAYMSTNVTKGRGEGIVTEIGMDTRIGSIASLIQNAPSETTPLQKRLGDLGGLLSIVSVCLCVLLFGIAVWQQRDVMEMLITAISLAVAAVPEGLPAIVTMVLALSVSRMVKVNVIVKRLPSVETLGCVSVVCSDKTGTLTQNRMTVTSCYTGGRSYGAKELREGRDDDFLRAYLLCNDASLAGGERYGDPTELALLDLAAGYEMERERVELHFPRTDELPFDSARKRMTTLHRTQEGTYISYTKGSPDEILTRCTNWLKDGHVVPLTEADRREIEEVLNTYTGNALRVLAAACCKELHSPVIREEGMVFLGFLGMTDPVRDGVAEAVEKFRHAGVRTVMITGDRMDTAFAIAKELGIAERREECLSGEEMDRLSDDKLDQCLRTVKVLAHVSPEHKVRIVTSFKRNGKIVAMTGDGVNDAPSLKAADVGIAMGMAGTDVAKNAADIVLTDDNFATITKAIEQGRCIYDNIKKSVLFLLSSNLGEIITMLAAVACGLAAPLKSSHILWINLITDSLPALALGIDVEEKKSHMNHPPRAKTESLFAEGGLSCTLFYGILIASISTVAFLQIPIHMLQQREMQITIEAIRGLLASEEVLSRCQTYAFTVLGMSQLFHAIGMRDVETSLLQMSHWKNKLMLLAVVVGVGLQLLVTEVPYLVAMFGTCLLAEREWGMLLLLAAAPLLAHEILVWLTNPGAKEQA